jgi:phenylpropionate dioxygenase-like ring-hydroxylating dioxygenase large terminal subunit
MSHAELVAMARHNMAHAGAGTIEQAPEIARVPAGHYVDGERFEREVERVFRRMPLMLAMSCELREPGDYKAMEVAGIPVLIARGRDGAVKSFVNQCSHRGAQLMLPGKGNTSRFTCPYHAWSYRLDGELAGVFAKEEFGDFDWSCHSLQELPTHERAGLIWVVLAKDAPVDFDAFLCGYDGLLGQFGFEDWHHFSDRTLEGPNWKIAYDGYLDLYHLPILHKDTFGSNFPHQTIYYAWGPHQRVTSPDPTLAEQLTGDAATWPTVPMLNGVWTIFPHISIASFDGGGGRGVMLSQLFPGDRPDQSFTVQNYVLEKAPNEEQSEAATAQFSFLETVVRDEDYATGLRQQRALATGMKTEVMFGRNEGGGQRFHGWVDRLLETDDADLPKLFERPEHTVAGLEVSPV